MLTALPNVTEQVYKKKELTTVLYFKPYRAQTMTLLLGLTLKQIPLPSWASVRLWRAETQDLRTYFVSNLQRQGRKRMLPKKVSPIPNLSYLWKWGSSEVYRLVSSHGSLTLLLGHR